MFPSLNTSTGSLLDKTLRYDMENPIFRKLQEAVEHPCRSKDWFGLAEQAINTVYALGEHPDVFCDGLIKKFTMRAFSRSSSSAAAAASSRPVGSQSEGLGGEDREGEGDPDAMDEDQPGDVSRVSEDAATASLAGGKRDVGDAFELSQLLFIVGHVAVKHIVFLELVEREWKRQKDVKQAGLWFFFFFRMIGGLMGGFFFRLV